MKSKSLDLGHASTDKQNRTFDFVNLYKSAAETSASFRERYKTSDRNDTATHKVKSESPKRERSPNKRKKKEKREAIDMSQIIIEGPGLNNSVGGSTPLNESKVTSTPLGNCKLEGKSSKVKSIMKNSSSVIDDTMEGSKLDTSTSKPKKRNKSVSFMLEENEDVVIKKTKSDDSTSETKSDSTSAKVNKVKKQYKKVKKEQQAEKENTVDLNQSTSSDNSVKEKVNRKFKVKSENSKLLDTTPVAPAGGSQSSQSESANDNKKIRKKLKKVKKPDTTESKFSTATESTAQEIQEKTKKPKKKKHQEKQNESDSEEPASKSRKKNTKPDVIAELENLSIGDNAHTITNLLDEMTVVDKEKRKKLKQKLNKNKKLKVATKTEDLEQTEDGPDKVKWRRRKWNKDTKAEAKEASLDTSIIVENLPLSMLFSYKKVLAEHFVKYGLIKTVGIAEVYPTVVSNPVFSTTINFYSDGAATQALQEDNRTLEGNHIRVKRPLAPTETTLVVRSYGSLTTQCISSTFSGAGRIRNIRHLVKGKHAMATFFIEFDGPESVERAMRLATNAKIGGKKIYASKFEVRTKKSKLEKTDDNEGSDADQSEDSQD